MEKWSNNTVLARKGINTKGQSFFYQRWSELLNMFSMDTYQVNVLNSHGALHELLEVLTQIKAGKISPANANELIKETIDLIVNDSVLKTNAQHLHNRLLHHLGPGLPEKREKLDTPITRLIFQIKHFLTHISPKYLGWLLEGLRNSILADDFEQIDKYCSSLASECIRLGWHLRGLYGLRALFEGYSSFEDKWSRFTHSILAQERTFDCIVSFDVLTKETSTGELISILQDFGLEVINGAEVAKEYVNVKNIPPISAKSLFFRVRISAYDVYSPAFKALEKIYRPLNIVDFTQLIDNNISKDTVFLTIDTERNYCRRVDLSKLYEVYHYIDSSSSVLHAVLRVLKKPTLSNDTKLKFQGVFLHSNLSKISLFQEVKFLNLWVALESFVRTGQHDTIIAHIKAVVPAALCKRYIHRLIRNFAEDCRRCEVKIQKANGQFVDLEQRPKAALVRELISIFQDDTLYPLLKKNCQINYLLEYRCAKIKSQIFDIKNLATLLKGHFQKVGWHLQRFYRFRNEIIHAAHFSTKPILTYIKNLREYISILVIEVVHEFDKYGYSCIEEVFEAIQDNYFATVDIFEQGCQYDMAILVDGVLEVK